MRKEYAKRSPLESLEPYYSRHVSAMTTEGLHAKSAIAAELAFRDARIAELEAALVKKNEGAVCGGEEKKLIEPLKCPFKCGSSNVGVDPDIEAVVCRDCGATGPSMLQKVEFDTVEEMEDAAIVGWNTAPRP